MDEKGWTESGNVKLTSEANDADLLVVEFSHELPRQNLHDVGTRLRWTVVVEDEESLKVHAEQTILQVLALDRAEQIDLALFESSKHDGWYRDVGRLLDVTGGIIVGTPTVEDDDLLLAWTVAAGTSQLSDEAVFVDELDLGVGHDCCKLFTSLLSSLNSA